MATARVVLRDGSSAGMRPTAVEDLDAMRRFFEQLSPDSRRRRFLGSAQASEDLLQRLCDNSDPQRASTLVVCRRPGDRTQIVGVGSYFSTTRRNAEVAFAVDDEFHGKGIATALLERLARLATQQDFTSFSATVLPENFEMLDVFRDSGFEVHSLTADGRIEIRLLLEPSGRTLMASDETRVGSWTRD